jgi:hypothetical protein
MRNLEIGVGDTVKYYRPHDKKEYTCFVCKVDKAGRGRLYKSSLSIALRNRKKDWFPTVKPINVIHTRMVLTEKLNPIFRTPNNY